MSRLHLCCLSPTSQVLVDREELLRDGSETIYVDESPRAKAKVKAELASWLRPSTPPEKYDAFFSYPHSSNHDGLFVERVYDATAALGAKCNFVSRHLGSAYSTSPERNLAKA